MQATFTVRRSPFTMLAVLATLLVALLLGGIGGYVMKGVVAPSHAAVAAAPATQPSAVTFEGRPAYVYEQGGRPLNVYQQDERPSTLYQQGGRPQVVYGP